LKHGSRSAKGEEEKWRKNLLLAMKVKEQQFFERAANATLSFDSPLYNPKDDDLYLMRTKPNENLAEVRKAC
jgi:hypothetical protein